jgi:hypothetical protein
MNPSYHKICKDFNSGNDLMKAIVSNNALVFYYLTQVLILDNNSYKNIELKAGSKIADQIVTDTLLVFRRQVKFSKVELSLQGEKVMINKQNLELPAYLANLFLLITETSSVNPEYEKNQAFEMDLTIGKGFRKIYTLKDFIQNTLQTFGCKDQQDKEEIVDESLLVFWKKLSQGEVGIYFTGDNQNLENCRVYNRKFYQSSKLGTYLTGIAKNLFYNKTRTSGFQVSRNQESELTDQDVISPENPESDTPALILFLFYRNRVEERKLRTVISILQYDCNLEDKDVRQLIGINNARIHSSRLRSHFTEWYYQNLNRIPELLDTANEYLKKRESKNETLNEKIRTIDLYRRGLLGYLDLSIFKEEFRSIHEFKQYYRIFKYVFFFTTTGKPSALSGLPDEKMLRTLMDHYKDGLFSLPEYQAILILLFYGSDEPGEIIIELMKSLYQELMQQDPAGESPVELTRQLKEKTPGNEMALTDEIYSSNEALFNHLSSEMDFIKMIYENESA